MYVITWAVLNVLNIVNKTLHSIEKNQVKNYTVLKVYFSLRILFIKQAETLIPFIL